MNPSTRKDGSRACIEIETDSPFLERLLADDCPEGVKIPPHPPYMLPLTRIPSDEERHFHLQVDLDQISAPIFVDWMLHRALAVRGRHLALLGRTLVSLRGPNAESVISRIIGDKATCTRRRRRIRHI